MAVSKDVVVRAYRHLYRSGLHAVQYSKPARYLLKETLRKAFRKSPASDFSARRIDNTVLFLNNAAAVRGVEHRVVRNILHVRYWEREHARHPRYASPFLYLPGLTSSGGRPLPINSPIRKAGLQRFEDTITMLNESMDLCLR